MSTLRKTSPHHTNSTIDSFSSISTPLGGQTTSRRIVQNTALRISTGYTKIVSIQHLHEKAQVLPLITQFDMKGAVVSTSTQEPAYPLHFMQITTITQAIHFPSFFPYLSLLWYFSTKFYRSGMNSAKSKIFTFCFFQSYALWDKIRIFLSQLALCCDCVKCYKRKKKMPK